MREEKGYTLVEMLLVLFMTGILLTWVVFSVNPTKVSTDEKVFVSQLQSDLAYVQSYAFRYQIPVRLTFYPENGSYIAKNVLNETLFNRKLQEGFEIKSSTLYDITFYPNGNTNRFGSINFARGGTKYQLTFQIGQGRYYVQKK
jgi:competence protein ComGD